jgi:hypothetical protein
MAQESIPKVTTAASGNLDLSFVFSLIGGILIVAGSVIWIGLAGIGRPLFWGMMGMMGGYGNNVPYMMGGYYTYGMMYGLEFLGIIAGTLVVVFSISMHSKPADRKLFGVLVLAFSLLSLTGMGGFFVGAILGLVGGVLALTNA